MNTTVILKYRSNTIKNVCGFYRYPVSVVTTLNIPALNGMSTVFEPVLIQVYPDSVTLCLNLFISPMIETMEKERNRSEI